MTKFTDKRGFAPTVVVRTCYDGDQFGELTYFTNDMGSVKTSYKEQMQLALKTGATCKKPKDYNHLTIDERNDLNKERSSAYTMEACDLLYIDKKESMKIIGEGMADEGFIEMLEFAWKIDLFAGIDRTHLLPLVSNIIKKTYIFGDYIQKQGEEPKGLMILKEGQAAVCAESLAARRVDKRHRRNNTEEYAEAAKYVRRQEVVRNRDL